MINLQPDEKIVLALHRHWIAFARKLFVIFIFTVAPLIVLLFMGAPSNNFYFPVAAFLSSVYYIVIFFVAFVFWVDYYLDMWIITDKRIVDVEQTGLFKREVSEFMISKVQDVTIEIPNFTASYLGFGNIMIQTAGEKNFSIKGVPNPDRAKDIILEYAEKAHRKQLNGFYF